MKEKKIMDKLKFVAKKTTEDVTSKATESASKLANATSQKYDQSIAKEKINCLVSATNKKYEEIGVKEKVNTITDKVTEHFDVISGQAMFQAIQDYLVKQEQYNNVLASKLVEALDRIRQLEEKVGFSK
ncbi:MAG: hypothetical protein AB7E04_10535 [Desulfobacteraceae bacterium]